MLGYLNRKLGNISVAAKLALGFAVVLLLTLATTLSGWRALDGAITRSEQLSEIGLINDLTKDLRAERITYRVLNDDASKAQVTRILTSWTPCCPRCSNAATLMSLASY